VDFTKLKEMRKAKGLTQAQAAISCGVSLMAYRLWEMGVGKPNRENYDKLLALFEVLPSVEK
jgi:transcriptional regulator with XRE-family HTH domain